MNDDARTTPLPGFLARLVWMLAGYPVLALLLLISAIGDSTPLSVTSVGFWVVVGLMLYARYVDVSKYRGTTTDGDRLSTLGDVKRYGAALTALAAVSWTFVHVV